MQTRSPSPSPFRPGPARRIRMLAFDRFEMLDVVGPLEAFATAAAIAGGGYTVEIVSAGGGLVRAASGLALAANPLETAGGAADTFLVAGGAGVVAACADGGLVERVRQEAAAARRVGSVCTGALLLGRAGLLDGRHAATHWNWCDRLAAACPAVTVERDRIYVRDGMVWTSAGVTAGIDLALALIEEDHGPELALAVARELVVYLKRPGGQAQFSAELKAQETRNGTIRRVQEWIAGHPEESLSIERLAAHAAMSVRNFARVFLAETGRTPGDFVEEIRVARAGRLLESSRLPVGEIARRAGFRSADVMRRAFLRQKGVSPGDYRDRFASTHSPVETP